MKEGSASSTAKVIAASTLLLAAEEGGKSEIPRRAVELCRAFLSTTPGDRLLAWCARHRPARWMLRWIERLTLPGIISHYWRRKHWIEERCRRTIAADFQRVVILGAGFDTLAMRLAPEFGEIRIIELDHPATQSVKRAAISRSGLGLPANLELRPLDLTAAEFEIEANSSTLFILEGVLMYLTEAEISSLLVKLRVPGARVIFSFMTKWPDGRSGFRPQSRLIDAWLRWRGEPFKWAIERELIAKFLTDHGFEMLEISDGGQNLKGENFVMCEAASGNEKFRSHPSAEAES